MFGQQHPEVLTTKCKIADVKVQTVPPTLSVLDFETEHTQRSPYKATIDKLSKELTSGKEKHGDDYKSQNGCYYIHNNEFLLGIGSYGRVFLGYYAPISKWVAIKELRYENIDVPAEILKIKEVTGQHINIVDYYELFQTPKFYYIVMGLYDYTLSRFLQIETVKSHQELYEERISLAKQLLSGLEFLHELGLIHRNLNPDNVMVYIKNTEHPVNLKLVDIGNNRVHMKDVTIYSSNGGGNPIWTYPDADYEHMSTIDNIFVAVMLLVYIISGGQHPFCQDGEGARSLRKKFYREELIRENIDIAYHFKYFINGIFMELYAFYQEREDGTCPLKFGKVETDNLKISRILKDFEKF